MASIFCTQANALLRKNLTYQKRNYKANLRLVLFPALLCLLFALFQYLLNRLVKTEANGGPPPDLTPLEWPPMLQIPEPQFRAVTTTPVDGLPSSSCRATGTCPATVLFTGNNPSLGKAITSNLFPKSFTQDSSDILTGLAQDVLGTSMAPSSVPITHLFDMLYSVQSHPCSSNSTFHALLPGGFGNISCAQGISLWRNTSSAINDQLYKGFMKGNPQGNINEITAAYDFLNTDSNNFNVRIWYNSSFSNEKGEVSRILFRVSRSVNLVSNAYLQFFRGPETKILFEFLKEFPLVSVPMRMDLSSALGPMFFIWVILQLFPIVLTSLVYEKEQKLRIMMKMHGLGDGPYWIITYAYFLVISSIYMLCFVLFGAFVGLKFFTMNAYSIQFAFFFIYINMQIAMAFLATGFFSNVKTATVVAYIGVFGTGLLGGFLFQSFIQDIAFPRFWMIILELYPGFSLYRGLYEFSQYAINGDTVDSKGMQWSDLSANENGMMEVMFIMMIEWLVMLCVAYYMDRQLSTGSGNCCLFSMKNFLKRRPLSVRQPGLRRQESNVLVQMDKPDAARERDRVEQLMQQPGANHVVVCDDIKKVYPGRDGNPEKFAVRGLSLALPRGECFGMLGPNGAGKTSFISMMIGLTEPTSGTAYVQGLDIRTQMGEIYTSMGVCPQHDLLWESLTGREHLLFYGRLKNLSGSALTQAVEKSLKDVNLFGGGNADKQARKYSGGMKRRLSVAISLIGDPRVVYMDEPSTGLDPASRKHLWDAVKRAKQDRAILLTTHSMEEADTLCDRLGIFVAGSLQCIGNPKELKARYGGSYVLTMTTPPAYDEHVENMVLYLSPGARKIYQISGTQKFELPKHEVRIADVFQAVENAKSRFTVQAWGLADTTLEDVFIKVAREAEAFNVLS